MSAVILPPSPNWFGAHLAAICPALRCYAFCAHHTIVLLDSSTCAITHVLRGHTNKTTAVAFATCPDGTNYMISASSDRTVRLWGFENPEDGLGAGGNPEAGAAQRGKWRVKPLRTCTKRPAEVRAITVASDENVTALLGDASGNVYAWSLRGGGAEKPRLAIKKETLRLGHGAEDKEYITCLAASPNVPYMVAVGSHAGQERIMDWVTGAYIGQLYGHHEAEVQCLRWERRPFVDEHGKPVKDLEKRGPGYVLGDGVSLLLSASSAGSVHVYEIHRFDFDELFVGYLGQAPMGSMWRLRYDSETGENRFRGEAALRLVLKLPPRPRDIPRGQQSRLWLSVDLAPGPIRRRPSSDSLELCVLGSGYGGQLLTWHVNMPMALPTMKSMFETPNAQPLPCRHSRSIFTIHSFIDSNEHASEMLQTGTPKHQNDQRSMQRRPTRPPPPPPEFHFFTTSMDRTVGKFTVPFPRPMQLQSSPQQQQQSDFIKRSKRVHTCTGLGAHPLCLTSERKFCQINVEASPRIAVGCGDSTIQMFAFKEPGVPKGQPAKARGSKKAPSNGAEAAKLNPDSASPDRIVHVESASHVWKGLPAAVTSIFWHPTFDIDVDILAFGCSDGSVGIAHCTSNAVALASTKHPGPITSLAWIEQPMDDDYDEADDYCSSSDGTDDASHLTWEDGDARLLSLSADGTLLFWPVWKRLNGLFNAGGSDDAGKQQQTKRLPKPAGKRSGGGVPVSKEAVDKYLGSPENRTVTMAFGSGVAPAALGGSTSASDAAVGGSEGGVAVLRHGGGIRFPILQPSTRPSASTPSNTTFGVKNTATTETVSPLGVAHVAIFGSFVAVIRENNTLELFDWPNTLARSGNLGNSVQLSADVRPSCLAVVGAAIPSYSGRVGLIAVGLHSGIIELWKGRPGDVELQKVGVLRGHGGTVLSMLWIVLRGADGDRPLLISSAEDQTVRAWGASEAMLAYAESARAMIREAKEEKEEEEEEDVEQQHESLAHDEKDQPAQGSAEATQKKEAAAKDENPAVEGSCLVGMRHEVLQPVPLASGSRVPSSLLATPLLSTIATPHTSQPKSKAKDVGFGSKPLLPPLQAAAANSDLQTRMQRALVDAVGNPPSEAGSHEFETLFGTSVGQFSSPHEPLADARAALLANVRPPTGPSPPLHQQRQWAQRAAALALWEGDVGQAIQILVDHDALTADFVSCAAAAGRAAWEAASRAYAEHLETRGEPHLAVMHLLSVGDVREACLTYERAGLLREATTLASVRSLPAGAEADDVALRLRTSYAAKLRTDGEFERAAAGYMTVGTWQQAVACLLERNTCESLDAAGRLLAAVAASKEEAGNEQSRLDDVENFKKKLLQQRAALLARQRQGTGGEASCRGDNLFVAGERQRYAKEDMLAIEEGMDQSDKLEDRLDAQFHLPDALRKKAR